MPAIRLRGVVWIAALAAVAFAPMRGRCDEIAPIPRRIPPPGNPVEEPLRSELEARIQEIERRLAQLPEHAPRADALVLAKAVKLALLHDEFYREGDLAAAQDLLDQAERRAEALARSEPAWTRQTGLVVRGYFSSIDGSPQPYGLVISEDLELEGDKQVPLYVWLHGRGDQTTDLHFIRQRQRQTGQIAPPGAIVLHPFGRHCLGFKSAGEIDVLEAVEHVKANYPIDPDRIALLGFSMGGAGAWHLGAHYADRWVALSPGAGFAETARYTRLAREDYPPPYEQDLWGVYDVPCYVRNLFNLPVVAYSGELDRQIQAARVMEEAFQAEGRKLRHIIGPGMGHRYHPDSLQEILAIVGRAVEKGRDPLPSDVHLQTRTLRYSRMFWVEALELEQHWRDSRIDAALDEQNGLTLATRNIAALRLHDVWRNRPQAKATIDGQILDQPLAAAEKSVLVRRDGRWSWQADKIAGALPARSADLARNVAAASRRRPNARTQPSAEIPSGETPPLRKKPQTGSLPATLENGLVKRPGLQGPIDDVFLEPFLVAAPEGKSSHPLVQRWIDFETAHFRDRWRAVFRGELRWKSAADVTPEDLENYHVILWGDPESNRLIRQINERLPVRWAGDKLVVGEQTFDAAGHVPALIYPNPLNPRKYVVLNSGPTFREEHDRTNSLQNPKLPDWAVIDLSQPPDGAAPGHIAAADFFDESWRLRNSRQTAPRAD